MTDKFFHDNYQLQIACKPRNLIIEWNTFKILKYNQYKAVRLQRKEFIM